MKVLVQWARSNATDWAEIRSDRWRNQPKKDDPTGQPELPVDGFRGWVNAINVQGVTFSGADHYAIEDVNDTTIKVYAWNDDPDTHPVGQEYGRIWLIENLQPDEYGAWNTKQTVHIYCHDWEDRQLNRPLRASGGPVQYHPWEDFVPPADDRDIRHGKYMPDALYEEHVRGRSEQRWDEWTEGVPAEELLPNGRLRPQAEVFDVGRQDLRRKPPEGTETYYITNTASATSLYTATHEVAMTLTGDTLTDTTLNSGDIGPGAGDQIFVVSSTPTSDPNLTTWPTGTYDGQVNVTAAGADIVIGYSQRTGSAGGLRRVDSTLATSVDFIQDDAGLTGTGTKTWSLTWTSPGGSTASDRFMGILAAESTSTGHDKQQVTISVNVTTTYVRAPWSFVATIDATANVGIDDAVTVQKQATVYQISVSDTVGVREFVPRKMYYIGSGSDWDTASNWSWQSNGSANAPVPTKHESAIFDNNSGNCTLDANAACKSLDLTQYVGTLDLGNSGYAFTVTDDLTAGITTTLDLGNATITIGGNFNYSNILSLIPDASTVVMTGSSKTLSVDGSSGLYNLTIASGASTTLSGTLDVTHTGTIQENASLTVNLGNELHITGASSSLTLDAATSSLTGDGAIGLSGATISNANNGTWDIAYMLVETTATINIGTYGGQCGIEANGGSITFGGNVTFSGTTANFSATATGAGGATLDNSGSHTITFHHGLTFNTGSGPVTWTTNAGEVVFANGVVASNLDLNGVSIDTIRVNRTYEPVQRLTMISAAGAESFIGDDGDFDLDGYTVTSQGAVDINGATGFRFWNGVDDSMANGGGTHGKFLVGQGGSGNLTLDGQSGTQLGIHDLDFDYDNTSTGAATYCDVQDSLGPAGLAGSGTDIDARTSQTSRDLGGTNTGWDFWTDQELTETVGITDNVIVALGGTAQEINATDTVGIDDAVSIASKLHYSITVSDNVALSDNYAIVIRSIFAITATDTFGVYDPGLTDAAARPITNGATDIGIYDVVTVYIPKVITVTDTIGLSDAVERKHDAERSFTDTIGITDDVALHAAANRTVTDTVGILDAVAITKSLVISVTDTIGITDDLARKHAAERDVADTVGILDAALLTTKFIHTVTDTIGITDDIAVFRALLISVTDTIGITDDLARKHAAERDVADTVGILDAVTARKYAETAVYLTDHIGISDDLARKHAAERDVTDTVGITDNVDLTKTLLRSTTDTVAITDNVTLTREISLSVTDTLGISDALEDKHYVKRDVTDTVGILDAVIAREYAETAVYLTDRIGITDALEDKHYAKRDVTDTVAVTDNVDLTKTLLRSTTDTVAVIDAVQLTQTFARTITDTLGISDVYVVQAYAVIPIDVTDTVAVTDNVTLTREISLSVSDTVAVNDSFDITKHLLRSVTDTIGIQSDYARKHAVKRDISDIVGVTDDATARLYSETAVYLTDRIGITDALEDKHYAKRDVTDTVGITDNVDLTKTLLRSTTDTVAITDNVQLTQTFARTITDTIGISDALEDKHYATRDVTDTIGILDAVIAREYTETAIYLTDRIGITDALEDKHYAKRDVTDTIGITDTVTATKSVLVTVTDFVAVTDDTNLQTIFARNVTDTVAVNDAYARGTSSFQRDISDNIAITDVTIARIYSETTIYVSDVIGLATDYDRTWLANRLATVQIAISEAVADVHAAFRTTTDVVAVLEAIELTKAVTRLLSTSISISDDTQRLHDALRNVTDIVAISDVVNVQIRSEGQIIVQDKIGLDDSYATLAHQLRNIVDTVSITDAYARTASVLLTTIDTLAITDYTAAVIAAAVKSITTSDLLAIDDTYIAALVAGRNITDTVAVDDVLLRKTEWLRLTTDTAGILDDTARKVNYLRDIANTVGITDDLAHSVIFTRLIATTLGVDDAVARTIARSRRILDYLAISDSLLASVIRVLHVMDYIAMQDALQQRHMAQRHLSERVAVYDTVRRTAQNFLIIQDSIAAFENVNRKGILIPGDGVFSTPIWHTAFGDPFG